jgi:TRAP-type C4-dicarboxylate transport system substrate-binding protein
MRILNMAKTLHWSRPLIAGAAGLMVLASSHAQEVVLKVHHIWPTVAMGHKRVVEPWCDAIAKDSNNRMRCQILPAMTGGGTPAQLVDRVKDGVDDLVALHDQRRGVRIGSRLGLPQQVRAQGVSGHQDPGNLGA